MTSAFPKDCKSCQYSKKVSSTGKWHCSTANMNFYPDVESFPPNWCPFQHMRLTKEEGELVTDKYANISERNLITDDYG